MGRCCWRRQHPGRGWPTESENFPEGGQWSAYAGPVWSLLSRPSGMDTDAHPDDAERHDLTITPGFTFIAPAISINTGEAMVLKVAHAYEQARGGALARPELAVSAS